MNTLVLDSWLREFLKTKAAPKIIAQSLSLSSQSIEKISKVGDDWVYEIEVTTNRPDCLSVYGITRELGTILPKMGIPAKFNQLRASNNKLKSRRGRLPLEVKITDPSLCPRFTALIFKGIEIKPSPKIVQERLEKSGIRALNNVVDISNYLMLELGQPMHTFDYDKIKGAKMILREANRGEKIQTLDGQIRNLPEGAIIIEDGEGRIIDLCGIMGGENSAVDKNTKRVLLFIQTYDPSKIRRTCQNLSFRTEAASRFEKGVDPEGVMLAMEKAITMFKKNCSGEVASNLIDIYPNPPKRKTVKLDLNYVNKTMGVQLSKEEVVGILKSLGFLILNFKSTTLSCLVPHWRYSDIFNPEDLVEEIARIYGYHRLPSTMLPQTTEIMTNPLFFWQERIKTALKYWGFTEVLSYSMIGEDLLSKVGLESQNYLKIANPLTSELVYMRPSLAPSILQIISQNQANFAEIRIFELSNIYIPQGKDNLPDEIPMLVGAQTGNKFFEIKGILEALFDDLGIKDYQFRQPVSPFKIFSQGKVAEIFISGKPTGFFGEVDQVIISRFEILSPVILFEVDLESLIKEATSLQVYTPIPHYPPIVEDLAFTVPSQTQVGDLIQLVKAQSSIIKSIELIDVHENSRTFRITYQHPQKTLSDSDIKDLRSKIIKNIEQKGLGKLK